MTAAQPTDLILSADDGVATIVINRPEKLNALRTQTYAELAEAFDHFRDASVGVIVLRGAGERAFSSGGDVTQQRGRGPNEQRAHLQTLLHTSLAIRGCGKPVIAAVDGWCIGAGNELQLWCDLTIATSRSTFGQVGPTVGSVPVWGATQILPMLVGEKRARRILYRCERFSAAEAEAMGMINEVVADDELDSALADWTSDLLDRSPSALRLAKLSMNTWMDTMWPALMSNTELLAQMAGGPEATEGQAAFLEKRAPNWRQFR